MKWTTLALWIGLSAVLAGADDIPKDSTFRVRLLSPVDTNTSQKDDKVSAQVLSPEGFVGDFFDGKITEAKGGNKFKGKAVLNFSFQTLHHREKEIPVSASIQQFANSKGQQDVDEEGRIIKKKNSIGKAAIGAGVGALIGGLAGGARGAGIGAGIGAAATAIFIQLGTDGPRIFFDAGSELTLSVKQR